MSLTPMQEYTDLCFQGRDVNMAKQTITNLLNYHPDPEIVEFLKLAQENLLNAEEVIKVKMQHAASHLGEII